MDREQTDTEKLRVAFEELKAVCIEALDAQLKLTLINEWLADKLEWFSRNSDVHPSDPPRPFSEEEWLDAAKEEVEDGENIHQLRV